MKRIKLFSHTCTAHPGTHISCLCDAFQKKIVHVRVCLSAYFLLTHTQLPSDTNINSSGHAPTHPNSFQRISRLICANLTGRHWAGCMGGRDLGPRIHGSRMMGPRGEDTFVQPTARAGRNTPFS